MSSGRRREPQGVVQVHFGDLTEAPVRIDVGAGYPQTHQEHRCQAGGDHSALPEATAGQEIGSTRLCHASGLHDAGAVLGFPHPGIDRVGFDHGRGGYPVAG